MLTDSEGASQFAMPASPFWLKMMPVEAAAFRTEHTRDFLSQQDCRDNFHYAHHEKNAFTFINISSYL